MVTVRLRNPYFQSRLSFLNFYRIGFYSTSDYQASWEDSDNLSTKTISYFTEKKYQKYRDETVAESMETISYLIGLGWEFESGYDGYNEWRLGLLN